MSFREFDAVYSEKHTSPINLFWHVYPLLHGDREIGDCMAAVARQRPADNRSMVFSVRSAKQQLNSNRDTVFSVRSVPEML
jgi:hypothetical protein